MADSWRHANALLGPAAPVPSEAIGSRAMSPRPLRLLAVLAIVAALGLAGCGDDDDSGGGGAADTGQEERSSGSSETGTETEAADLTDTSVKPVIEKPSGVPPRKLVKEDIVKGKGPVAKPGDTVIVHYVGVSFSNGEEFDASWDAGQPFPVQLGAGQVIEGWERGLLGIRAGGRRKLTIPPEQAYGAEGAPPSIAPNETLVFVIDALEIQ
jgi:peptidylprolyl isomerase